MNEKKSAIHMEDLVPIIREVLETGSEFRLYPRGRSMLPTIVEGQDSVMLAKPTEVAVGMPCCIKERTDSMCCTASWPNTAIATICAATISW